MNLRRPPTLSVVDGPFVPDGERGILDDVERRWEALCAANPAYFDGRLYHVLGVHRNGCGGAVLHVANCAYRFHAVQTEEFDLGIRPLGIKGITRRGGRVLLGRRAMNVASYPGLWEFAPGGGVEPGDPPDAQPALTAVRELREETGWTAQREPKAIAILYDETVRCWEIIFEMVAADQGQPTTAEYDDLAWHSPEDLPTELSAIARRMIHLI